ncbi:MAG: hypothetical protein RI935_129 [Candidatus Parcubacteria bacterium]|jgi:hypothetical protein
MSQRKKSNRGWLRVMILILSALLVSYGIFLYRTTSYFLITSYTVVGIDDTKQEALVSLIRQAEQGNSFFLFPHNKSLTYNHQAIVKSVNTLIADTQSVSVALKDRNTIVISIERFVPLFRVSTSTVMSKEGVIFDCDIKECNLPFFELSFATSTKKISGSDRIVINSLEEEYLEELAIFVENIQTTLFKVERIILNEDNDILLYKEGGSSYVIIEKEDSLSKTWLILLSAIDTNPLKEELINKKEALKYIDIRFGNKVFYRFGDKHVDSFQKNSSSVRIDDHDIQATTTLR